MKNPHLMYTEEGVEKYYPAYKLKEEEYERFSRISKS